MNVSHLSNELLEEDQLSQSSDTVLHKLTDLHIICLILVVVNTFPSWRKYSLHGELICSAIRCINTSMRGLKLRGEKSGPSSQDQISFILTLHIRKTVLKCNFEIHWKQRCSIPLFRRLFVHSAAITK